MFCAGDTIENPVTGERIVFVRTASESNGEEVVVETFVRPDGFVAAAHVHPNQEERFEIISGTVGFRAGGRSFELGPGGRVSVPAGTAHRFWNAGDEEARFLCTVRPALHFEDLLAAMFALAADGKTNAKGLPNPLRLAVVARAYADTVRLPFPPVVLQRLGLAMAAPLGWALGYRPVYPAPQARDRRTARPGGPAPAR
jgi:mannose-6-phosphate isomerase-like protein (cupin superfamily)